MSLDLTRLPQLEVILMRNPSLYILMLFSFFLYFSFKRYRPDSVPMMSFVDSWRSARGIFRLFSWVEFAVLAASDLLYSTSGDGEVRVCSCSMTLICHCQSLMWATSWEHLPRSSLLRRLMSSPYSQTDRNCHFESFLFFSHQRLFAVGHLC